MPQLLGEFRFWFVGLLGKKSSLRRSSSESQGNCFSLEAFPSNWSILAHVFNLQHSCVLGKEVFRFSPRAIFIWEFQLMTYQGHGNGHWWAWVWGSRIVESDLCWLWGSLAYHHQKIHPIEPTKCHGRILDLFFIFSLWQTETECFIHYLLYHIIPTCGSLGINYPFCFESSAIDHLLSLGLCSTSRFPFIIMINVFCVYKIMAKWRNI